MNRRRFLAGLLSTPAVITTPGLLMPVRAWPTLYPYQIEMMNWLYASTPRVRFVNCGFVGHEVAFIGSNGQVQRVTQPEWSHHA